MPGPIPALADWQKVAVAAIFALTYVLISARRVPLLPVGRAGGALLGAALMVATGALSPEESYQAVDHNTLVLLFGMMAITAYVERSGFFAWAAQLLLRVCCTPMSLLAGTAVASAALSALLVNDTVCVFLTPVIVAACRRGRLPMGPYLLALATSANLGSAATLVGNPQNMIIGSLSAMPFRSFLWSSAPAATAGVAINIALLWLYFRRRLPASFDAGAAEAAVDRAALARALVVLACVAAAFFAGLHLGYSALGGAVALMVLDREDPRPILERVDWPLLVFFCGLFIVVKGLAQTGWVDAAWEAARPQLALSEPRGLALFTALMVAGSNLVSNVPMVLLTGPHLGQLGSPELGWVLLGFTTTVAGNLTLIGSVANIIVAESARRDYQLGFWEYLRFGPVSTLATLAAGVPLTALWHRWSAG